jgi:hypothetical protein
MSSLLVMGAVCGGTNQSAAASLDFWKNSKLKKEKFITKINVTFKCGAICILICRQANIGRSVKVFING